MFISGQEREVPQTQQYQDDNLVQTVTRFTCILNQPVFQFSYKNPVKRNGRCVKGEGEEDKENCRVSILSL